MTWVPLTVHSQYSILQSSIGISQLIKRASELEFSTIGVTDGGNLYGAVDFYKKATKSGIKPIIGSKVYLSHGSHREKSRLAGRPNSSSLFLLAKNRKGYENLCKLSSIGFLDGFYYRPRIDKELLFSHSEGLICLGGGLGSYLGYYAAEHPSQIDDLLEQFSSHFKTDLYLQIENYEMSEALLDEGSHHEESWLMQRYESEQSQRKDLYNFWMDKSQHDPLQIIASHEVNYLYQKDWRAHEVLMNVQSGETLDVWQYNEQRQPTFKQKNPKRDVLASHEHFLKSEEEIKTAFSQCPDSCFELTQEIADKCEFSFDFKTKHYPSFQLPETFKSTNPSEGVGHFLRQQCQKALNHRYDENKLKAISAVYPHQEAQQVIQDRLEDELNIIISKGLEDYLLIVADFIQWAKEQKIPVGPGRGSGAGSIICYLLGITDIEPLRFHLFFERFINPERESYPDIDVDICMERRGEVINYMLNKYGRENVAQIITFGTMKAKMSIKDVGRVLNVSLSKVNGLAKLFPDDINGTLKQALDDPEIFQIYNQDPQIKELFDMAQVLEGCIRNTGIHAAGLIICAQPLQECVPLCVSKDAAMPVTQYSMKPSESVGMLKIDFLGLKTLTSIQTCVDDLKRNRNIEIDWMNLNLEDAQTFELLNRGQTLGVFQLESGGMQDLARQLHLDRFEEIIAVVSLYRPGPMDMIPSFIARKHGLEPIEYDHPQLKNILSETYGIMVYQEQVMQIASQLAGFTLAEGDVLRRAMGKKDADEMACQRVKFLQGAQEKGIEESVASLIFDKMEKFAAYGFNKSHAAAYGYIAYITAYLKAHYPSEWMAALMTCDRDDISKVSKFISEARSMSIEILPPDINESGSNFTARKQGIRFALCAIKGVGVSIVETIVKEREENGPYKSLYDFIDRTHDKRVSRKVFECLIDAGALDFTNWSKDQLLESLESMISRVAKAKQEYAQGFMNLFEMDGASLAQEFSKPPIVAQQRKDVELYLREKELLGFFLTGNPLESYKKEIASLYCVEMQVIEQLDQTTPLRIAFIIDELVVKVSQRSQKKYAILKISDGLSRYELPIWPDTYDKVGMYLKENAIFVSVLVAEYESGVRLNCKWLQPIEMLNEGSRQLCDHAYDKAKEQIQRIKWAKANKPESSQQPKKRKEKKSRFISIDCEKITLSQLLKLSTFIKEFPGEEKLKVYFNNGPKGQHCIHVGSEISWSPFYEKIKHMPLKEMRL